jgi:hypothetical protein
MTRDHHQHAPQATPACDDAGRWHKLVRNDTCVYMGAVCSCNANAFNRICVSIALQRKVAAVVGG